jgi:pimeloyl-ACP methyl ester carboxylesterase
LDELIISAAHFVGHSHGALVTLESALRYPQRVLSLTLLEAGLIAVVPSAPLAAPAFEPVMRRYADGQPVEALRALSRVIFGPDWRDDLRGDSAVALVNAKATFESDFASMPLWNFPETARGVCQPVLSILGGLSDATFVQTLGFPAVSEVRELLDRFIPHCRHVVLTNLNHALQMTDPRAVGNAIGSFLDCLPATTHE